MSGLRYGSVCSGIEAVSQAWEPLGMEPAWFSEIDPFACAYLAHHYPTVPNRGDMTRFKDWPDDPIDVLVGGTPCQSFSVAGLRGGMADPRGNLALVFLAIADRFRPRYVVWENVPGVLSSGGGRDFGSFLGGLAELGYGWAYRVLDAQYFGVAQRRRRVFVVGHPRAQRAAAVLFERACLRGDPAPSRAEGEGVASAVTRGLGSGGQDDNKAQGSHLVASVEEDNQNGVRLSNTVGAVRSNAPGTKPGGTLALVARSLNAHPSRSDGESETFVTHALRADGFDASEDGTGRGTPLVATGFHSRQDPINAPGLSLPLERKGGQAVAVDGYNGSEHAQSPTLGTNCGQTTGRNGVREGYGVRRLTPRECERLQGFPDDATLIPVRQAKHKKRCDARDVMDQSLAGTTVAVVAGVDRLPCCGGKAKVKMAADGPRYRALGNSMAVPVVAWIGRRILAVEAVQ